MAVLSYIIFLLVFIYSVSLLLPALKWYTSREFKFSPVQSDDFITIIIPARNEAAGINACISSLISQDYPPAKFEIIVVDDCSEDQTSAVVQALIHQHLLVSIQLIRLKENPYKKKGALLTGIKKAKGSLIITRDADTISPSPYWLSSIAAFYSQQKSAMVICPLYLYNPGSFFATFQQTENYVLQSLGGGMALFDKPFLCNGANLVFSKSAFEEAGGYTDNFETASGDDIFLLEKFRNAKFKISYLKSNHAAAVSLPQQTLKSFVSQKLRWTGKFNFASNIINTYFAFLIFGLNFLFAISAVLSLFFSLSYKYLAVSILLKWFIDFLLLILPSLHRRNFKWIPWFIFLEIFNHFYLLVIPMASIFVKPRWKGRRI